MWHSKLFAGLALMTVSTIASAQSNSGLPSSQLGSGQAPSNNPGSGAGDMPGGSVSVGDAQKAAGGLKGAYGLDLARRIASAQKLVDQVNGGRVLTDSDVGRIRSLMREDFIAWDKRYDLPPSFYRAERDKWLVGARPMPAKDWAKHRLDWLNAQRDWVVAHGG